MLLCNTTFCMTRDVLHSIQLNILIISYSFSKHIQYNIISDINNRTLHKLISTNQPKNQIIPHKNFIILVVLEFLNLDFVREHIIKFSSGKSILCYYTVNYNNTSWHIFFSAKINWPKKSMEWDLVQLWYSSS